MNKKLVAGYAEHGPGLGPFRAIFHKGVDLTQVENLKGLDAIILWGGSDISPSLYGEEPIPYSGPKQPSARDVFEWELMRMAQAADIPIIGVCRGLQMICAFAGGKLVQDVEGHGSIGHKIVTHTGEIIHTNSYHHQMTYPYDIEHKLLAWVDKPLSKVYQPSEAHYSARLSDGLVKEPEAVWFPQVKGIGIQGHPEWMEGSRMASWFIEEIREHCFKEDVCTC